MGIDFYAFSGHKTYGPTGIGVLWGRHELLTAMPPFLTGGQMVEHVTLHEASFRQPPRRFEAGTPPIAAAVGLGAALDWMQKLDWVSVQEHEMALTRRILDGFSRLGVRVLGPADTKERRGVISFVVDGVSADEVCRFLDTKGVALRGGYHCAQPLVRAFGVDGAARASLAPYSVDADVDALLEGVAELVKSRSARQPEQPLRLRA
jgi:cysteine desulfurase/selenocysteine lyase